MPNRLQVVDGADHSFDHFPGAWERCLEVMSAFLGELTGAPAVAG